MSERRLTVWRYEDIDQKGPYNCSDVWRGQTAMCDAHDTASGHPAWFGDGLDHVSYSGWLSGCPDRKSLMWWFDGYQAALNRAGFFIMSFRVPEDRVKFSTSRRQVAFDRGSIRGVVHPWSG